MLLDVEGTDGADTAPNPPHGSTVTTRLSQEHADSVAAAVEDSYAENTRRAYASSMRRYRSWLAVHGYADDWDPLVVAAYLASMAADAPSSVEVARAALLHYAGREGGPDAASLLRDHPGVRATVRGVRRQQRGYTPTKARAFSRLEILTMAESCPETPQGLRDRAVLLMAVSLGLRASDVVSLRTSGVTEVEGGLELTVPYAKTSDAAVTLALPRIGGPLCGVSALQTWLQIVERVDGERGRGRIVRSVRRGGWSVGDANEQCSTEVVSAIVYRLVDAAGLDRSRGRVSAHSFRASFATGALAHFGEAAVAATGRWSSLTVLRGYDRTSRWSPSMTAGGWLGR